MTAALLGDGFRERFALAELAGEGVLIDLESGAFFRVGPSAARVLAAAARGQPDDSREAALVAEDLAALIAAEPAAAPAQSPLRFITGGARGDARVLCWQDAPCLSLAADGLSITRAAEAPPPGVDWAGALLWLAPHVLVGAGVAVLHASAVSHGGRVTAFSGTSGSGKTTTARAAAEAGARSISEDLVIVTRAGAVVVTGEPIVRAWSAERAAALATRDVLSAADLVAAVRGAETDTLPLAEIDFLSAVRRTGDRLARAALAPADALVRLLENGFAELPDPRVWRHVLGFNAALASALPCFDVTVPDGIDALRAALKK